MKFKIFCYFAQTTKTLEKINVFFLNCLRSIKLLEFFLQVEHLLLKKEFLINKHVLLNK